MNEADIYTWNLESDELQVMTSLQIHSTVKTVNSTVHLGDATFEKWQQAAELDSALVALCSNVSKRKSLWFQRQLETANSKTKAAEFS